MIYHKHLSAYDYGNDITQCAAVCDDNMIMYQMFLTSNIMGNSLSLNSSKWSAIIGVIMILCVLRNYKYQRYKKLK